MVDYRFHPEVSYNYLPIYTLLFLMMIEITLILTGWFGSISTILLDTDPLFKIDWTGRIIIYCTDTGVYFWDKLSKIQIGNLPMNHDYRPDIVPCKIWWINEQQVLISRGALLEKCRIKDTVKDGAFNSLKCVVELETRFQV